MMMIPALYKSALLSTLLALAACSSTPKDPYPEFAQQEAASDQALTPTPAEFVEKYQPASIARCEALTHEAYDKGTRCYRVINRNLQRDYDQAADNTTKRDSQAFKRYYASFTAYYQQPTSAAKQKAADRALKRLQARLK